MKAQRIWKPLYYAWNVNSDICFSWTMWNTVVARTSQQFASLMTLPPLMGLRLSSSDACSSIAGEFRCLSTRGQLGADNARVNQLPKKHGWRRLFEWSILQSYRQGKQLKAFFTSDGTELLKAERKVESFSRRRKRKVVAGVRAVVTSHSEKAQRLLRNTEQEKEKNIMPSNWTHICVFQKIFSSAIILTVKYSPLYKQK